MIAWFHRIHACSDLANDPGPLMAEDRWKDAFAVQPVEGVGIGMADARCLYLDQDLAGLRAVQIEFDDFEGFFCFEGYGGACFHLLFSSNTLLERASQQRTIPIKAGNILQCPKHCTLIRHVKTAAKINRHCCIEIGLALHCDTEAFVHP